MSSSPSRTTRIAQKADLPFVVDLQKKWSNAVGFLPRVAIARAIDEHRVLLVDQDALEAGYLLITWSRAGVLRVAQIAIAPDLLRTTLGTKIMHWLDRAAVRSDASMIRLKSRVDLPANLFWPVLGFHATGYLSRATTRNRPLLEWTKILVPMPEVAAEARGFRRRRRPGERLPTPCLRLDPADRDLDHPPPTQ